MLAEIDAYVAAELRPEGSNRPRNLIRSGANTFVTGVAAGLRD